MGDLMMQFNSIPYLIRYEGEWHNNKKHGYGVTTFRDGVKEEGKYKCNVLITSQKKKHLFLIRSAKFRERIEAAVSSSQRASKYALQKADIAVSRTATARGKGEMADNVADNARVDSEIAVATAREFAPDFKPSVLDRFERIRVRDRYRSPPDLNMHHHAKPPLIHAATIDGTPNHHSAMDNRTQQQHNNDATPQKQATFSQPSIRRSSLLQKQASVDYSSMGNTSVYTQQAQQNHPNMSASPGGYGNPMHPAAAGIAATAAPSPYNQYTQPNVDSRSNGSGNYSAHTYPDPQSNQTNSYNYTSNIQRPQQNYADGGGVSQQNAYGPSKSQQQAYTTYNNTNSQTNHLNQSYPNYYAGPSNNYPLDQNYSQMSYVQQKAPGDMNDMLLQQQSIQETPGHSNLRRNSRPVSDSVRPPMLGNFSQSSIDHYDHYKRPPSRDSSVDRYARAAGRLGGSRQTSIDRTAMVNNQLSTGGGGAGDASAPLTLDRSVHAGSAFRTTTATAMCAAGVAGPPPIVSTAGNGSVMTGVGVAGGSRADTPLYQMISAQPVYSSPHQPFEDVLLRQRTLGQDIIPSPREPKRTESLYLPPKLLPTGGAGSGGAVAAKGKLKVRRKYITFTTHSITTLQSSSRHISPITDEHHRFTISNNRLKH